MSDEGRAFWYGRQWAVLGALAAALTTLGDRVPLPGAMARFGLYGALYAGVLAVTVRAPTTAWRRLGFCAAGALSSAAVAALGLEAGRLGHALPGGRDGLGILILCAGLGAAACAMLLRIVWRRGAPPALLRSACIGCMLAVAAVFFLHAAARASGAWIAIAWWCAFSLALWSSDVPVRGRRGSSAPG